MTIQTHISPLHGLNQVNKQDRKRSSSAIRDRADEFLAARLQKLKRIDAAGSAWNDAVATLVEQIGNLREPLASRQYGVEWHSIVANSIRSLQEPLKSDLILSAAKPSLKRPLIKGSIRAHCASILDQDLEFMPGPREYPKFPYFEVEPGTAESLHRAGLYLFSNPPAADEDEPDEAGSPISLDTYLKSPMISVDLDLDGLDTDRAGAVLLNWSFRGRMGARAKIFINGEQDVESFEVASSDDDVTPNFWTFVPWTPGKIVIDLKHVGDGYLWFEHVDVHHIVFPTSRLF